VVASRSFFHALVCASSGLVLAIAIALPSLEANGAAASAIAQIDDIWTQAEQRSEEQRLQSELARLRIQLEAATYDWRAQLPRPPVGDFSAPGRLRRD
jgi:hypothetical protein